MTPLKHLCGVRSSEMGREKKADRPTTQKDPNSYSIESVNSAYLPQFYKNEIKIRKE